MKLLFFALLFTSILFPQQERYYTFSDIWGMEDSSADTHLFYRLYYSFDSEPITDRHQPIYHMNIKENTDTLFLNSFFYRNENTNSYRSYFIHDFTFWHNDPARFIYCGAYGDFTIRGYVKRFDSDEIQTDGIGVLIDLSRNDDSILFISNSGSGTLTSSNGGFDWKYAGAPFSDYLFQSLTPYGDSIIFSIDKEARLNKSYDGGLNYVIVDSSRPLQTDSGKDYFFYDKSEKYIYRKLQLNGAGQLIVSNNYGEPFSWSVKYQSENEIFLSIDYSQSGHIYLADGKRILRSTDYGESFHLFKEFERRLVGIYKKPASDKLYAATKFDLYEIDNNSIRVIKHLEMDPEIFSYYPLAVGNKWVYHWSEWSGYPDYSEGITSREVIKDTVLGNEEKYFKINHLYMYNHFDYERIDSINGKVLRYKDTSDIVIDDLAAEPGDTLFIYNRFAQIKDLPTIAIELENIVFPWQDSAISKPFDFNSLVGFKYYLSKNYGLTGVRSSYDFGVTSYNLKGCIINGVVYGDTTVVGIINEEIFSEQFTLSQNYPNPFNPATKIKFTIPNSPLLTKERGGGEVVSLKIYDVLGTEIATLVNEEKPAGEYEVEFNASGLSSGIYFYQLKAGSNIQTKKIILMK